MASRVFMNLFQGSDIRPSSLLSQHDAGLIQTSVQVNILTKFGEYISMNMATRMLTNVSYGLNVVTMWLTKRDPFSKPFKRPRRQTSWPVSERKGPILFCLEIAQAGFLRFDLVTFYLRPRDLLSNWTVYLVSLDLEDFMTFKLRTAELGG